MLPCIRVYTPSPNARPCAGAGEGALEELQQHPFFEGIQWAGLLTQKAPDFVLPEPEERAAAAGLDWNLNSYVGAQPLHYEYEYQPTHSASLQGAVSAPTPEGTPGDARSVSGSAELGDRSVSGGGERNSDAQSESGSDDRVAISGQSAKGGSNGGGEEQAAAEGESSAAAAAAMSDQLGGLHLADGASACRAAASGLVGPSIMPGSGFCSEP